MYFWVSRSFDLDDLGVLEKSWGNIFNDYIFEISRFHWSKFTVEFAIYSILILKSAQARCVTAPKQINKSSIILTLPWICASHSETSTEIPQIAICSVLSDFIKNGKFASNYIKKGDFTGSKTSLEFKVLFTYFLGKILIWLDLVEIFYPWLLLCE